jgi:hypothetical protein
MQSSDVTASRAGDGDTSSLAARAGEKHRWVRRRSQPAARPSEEKKATVRNVRIMHGAVTMTPIGIQLASREARSLIVQRTPAAWRAYVHRRRAWLAAADLHFRQRPHSRRAKAPTPVEP